MYHLFLGRSSRLKKRKKKKNLQKTRDLYISISSKTWLRAASGKVASLDWKDRLPIFHKAERGRAEGIGRRVIGSSRLAVVGWRGGERASEWWEKAKCSSHKAAGLHSSVHAGPLKQMLTVPQFWCSMMLDCCHAVFQVIWDLTRAPVQSYPDPQKTSVSLTESLQWVDVGD